MPFVPAEGVITAQMIYERDGQRLENVLNFDVPDSTMEATGQELGENLVTWFDTFVKPLLATNISLVRIDLNDASDEHGFAITYTDGLPIQGTLSGSADAPNNVTVAVKQTTAGRGRAYRGRSFFPALVSAQYAQNTLTEAAANAIQAAWEELISLPMTAGSAKLSVISKWIGGVARVVALVSNVVAIFVDRTLDSQRRRLPGRGQ
jgi:hypothetical protein